MIYETVMEWAKYRDYILPALEYCAGSHNEDDLIAGLIMGDEKPGGFKLWKGEGCAIVSHFVQFPRMKILNLWLAGGDLSGLIPLEAQIMAYAKQHGCAQVRTGGRDGWGRALPGAEKLGTVFMRAV